MWQICKNDFICRRCLMRRVEMGRWGLTWGVWVKEKCGWMVKALVVIGFPFSHLLVILLNLCKWHTCPLTTHYELRQHFTWGYNLNLIDADIIFQGRFWNHLEIYWWFLKRKVVILLGSLWILYRLLVLTKLNLNFHEDCLCVWIFLYFCVN